MGGIRASFQALFTSVRPKQTFAHGGGDLPLLKPIRERDAGHKTAGIWRMSEKAASGENAGVG